MWSYYVLILFPIVGHLGEKKEKDLVVDHSFGKICS